MEVRLILMCSVILTLSSVICGPSSLHENIEFDGLHGNSDFDDTALVDSSPSDTRNVFHIYQSPGQIPETAMYGPETRDATSYSFKDYLNGESDQNKLTDTGINSLVKSIRRIETKLSSLDNKLENIHEYIASSCKMDERRVK